MTTSSPNSDELLRELEESMPQGRPNDIQYRRAEDAIDSDLLDLDTLLAESVAKRDADEQYKKDRDTARKGFPGLSKEEVEFCNSRMRAWEMLREWDADRAVAVFTQFYCPNCDTARFIFSRFMEHHQHRFVKSTHRWVSVKETKIKQIETVLEERVVAMCTDCCTQFDIQPPADEPVWLQDLFDGTEDPQL